MIRFEKYNFTVTSSFLVFFNCIIKDALINFWGIILIENTPKRRILCVRENPVVCFKNHNKYQCNFIDLYFSSQIYASCECKHL